MGARNAGAGGVVTDRGTGAIARAAEEFDEVLDRDDLPLADTRRALRDLGRVNLLLFGRRALKLTLLPLLRNGGPGRRWALDVAAGAGDAAPSLRRAATRVGVDLRIVATDRKVSHLQLGRSQGTIDLAVVARAEALPFRARSFDWSISTLFFHHLDEVGKVRVLREMRTVTTRSAVVVDLRRSRRAEWAFAVLGRLLGLGRIALGDGRTSLRRTLSLAEWNALSRRCGASLRRRFPARVVMIVQPREVEAIAASRASGGAPESPDSHIDSAREAP